MTKRIPQDAFEFYVSLGPDRSYAAVAEHFDVSKRGVTKRSKAELWAERLQDIEKKAREKSDTQLGETLGEIRERHLKTLKAMNMRALEALRTYPLNSGMEALRAAEVVIKLERLVHGEPTDRSALSIEEVIKREYEGWTESDDDQEPE